MTRSPFLKRCQIKNFRSIAACDVSLQPLTVLVGPNGSGKSNFLDALRLVADSLQTTLEHALRERGGVEEVRRRSNGHPTNFQIGLDLDLGGIPGSFAFEVGATKGAFRVTREECVVGAARYEVRDGVVRSVTVPDRTTGMPVDTTSRAPQAMSDRLFLVTMSGHEAFRPAFDRLSRMGFYNVNPDQVRVFQPPDTGDLLARDARNLASVVRRMAAEQPEALARVTQFLQAVVPGILGVESVPVGHMLSLVLTQSVEGARDPWRFGAITMSDGTLRALAVLVALFQPAIREVSLVGIEEPETALHPAAAGLLFDALLAATRHTQVLVTTHSPDLLDHSELEPEQLLAVVATAGRTQIAPVDSASRDAMKSRLYTGGELLRTSQLAPDLNIKVPKQLDLGFQRAASR